MKRIFTRLGILIAIVTTSYWVVTIALLDTPTIRHRANHHDSIRVDLYRISRELDSLKRQMDTFLAVDMVRTQKRIHDNGVSIDSLYKAALSHP